MLIEIHLRHCIYQQFVTLLLNSSSLYGLPNLSYDLGIPQENFPIPQAITQEKWKYKYRKGLYKDVQSSFVCNTPK
jgi:hypothetical protein